jgi:hypothetical protein
MWLRGEELMYRYVRGCGDIPDAVSVIEAWLDGSG